MLDVTSHINSSSVITLKEAGHILNYKRVKSVKDFCKAQSIPIAKIGGRNYVLYELVIANKVANFIRPLEALYGIKGIEVFQHCTSVSSDKVRVLQEIISDNRKSVIQHRSKDVQMDTIFENSIVADMEPLFIPPEKKQRGLNVVCFCYKCGENVYELCKDNDNNNRPIQQCENGSRHAFKFYYENKKGKRVSQVIPTRNVEEAFKIAEAIKENEFSSSKGKTKTIVIEKPVEQKEIKQAPLLKDVVNKFYNWMAGINVQPQFIKERSKEYLKEIKLVVDLILSSTENAGMNLEEVRMNSVDDDFAGIFFNELERRGFKNRTFNKYLNVANAIINYYREEYDPLFKNPFKKIPRRRVIHKAKAISREEFEDLMTKVTPENSIQTYGSGATRNHFKSYTKDAFNFLLQTGLRRESALSARYSDINYTKKHLRVSNFKVNRIQKRTGDTELEILVPLTDSLLTLIEEIRQKNNSVDTDYIIAPEQTGQGRMKTLSNELSRSFKYFYKQTKHKNNISLKSLRKRYITDMSQTMGAQTFAVTGHSEGSKVLDENYKDKSILVSIAASKFKLFQEEEKQQELEQIRNSKKSLDQTIEK